MSKRRKSKAKLGRPRNIPQQKTQTMPQQSVYGSVIPFTTMNGKKHVVPKPNSLAIRNFSRNNAVVRRCINLVKDAIARKKFEVYDVDGNDNKVLKEIFMALFKAPNSEDTSRTFISAVGEDLISGDCGCIEIAKGGNPDAPLALFSVDGFGIEIVLGNDVIKFAQRQSGDYTAYPTEYKYFTGNEILYLKKQCFTSTPYGLSAVESAWDYIRALTNTFNYSAEIASNALPKYMANIKGIQGEVLNAYRAYFEQDCMGTPNLPLVSAEDIKSVQIAPISEEATFKGYQELCTAIIAMNFGVPAEKVAVAKSNDRSTIAEINESLLQECIIPYCAVFEEAFNKIIAMMGYADKVAFRFIHEETQAQKQSKQSMALELFEKDGASVNEVRAVLGLPPTNDEYGNDRITLYKAKVNEKYTAQQGGYNGSGDIKSQNTEKKPESPKEGGG